MVGSPERADIDAANFKAREQQIVVAHNREETPLFAKDIERKAQEGRWSR